MLIRESVLNPTQTRDSCEGAEFIEPIMYEIQSIYFGNR